MKKIFILIAFLSIIVSCSTDKKNDKKPKTIDSKTSLNQKINLLDQRNGFKDIKLGTKRKDISTKYILVRDGYLLEKPGMYQVLSSEHKVFNEDITVFWMQFDNNDKLYKIILNVGSLSSPNEFLSNFTSLFGNPNKSRADNSFDWFGNKVRLQIDFNPSRIEKDKTGAIIQILDINRNKENIDSGF